jgi:hypothetical protein
MLSIYVLLLEMVAYYGVRATPYYEVFYFYYMHITNEQVPPKIFERLTKKKCFIFYENLLNFKKFIFIFIASKISIFENIIEKVQKMYEFN